MKPPLRVQSPDLTGIQHGDFEQIYTAISNLYEVANQLAGVIATRAAVWQDVPYNAGDFTTNAGGLWNPPWSGAAGNFRLEYARIDDLLIVSFSLYGGTIGNAVTNELRIKTPAGFIPRGAGHVGDTGWLSNGVSRKGIIQTVAGQNYLTCTRWDDVGVGGNYPQSGAAFDSELVGTCAFRVVPRAGN